MTDRQIALIAVFAFAAFALGNAAGCAAPAGAVNPVADAPCDTPSTVVLGTPDDNCPGFAVTISTKPTRPEVLTSAACADRLTADETIAWQSGQIIRRDAGAQYVSIRYFSATTALVTLRAPHGTQPTTLEIAEQRADYTVANGVSCDPVF